MSYALTSRPMIAKAGSIPYQVFNVYVKVPVLLSEPGEIINIWPSFKNQKAFTLQYVIWM